MMISLEMAGGWLILLSVSAVLMVKVQLDYLALARYTRSLERRLEERERRK